MLQGITQQNALKETWKPYFRLCNSGRKSQSVYRTKGKQYKKGIFFISHFVNRCWLKKQNEEILENTVSTIFIRTLHNHLLCEYSMSLNTSEYRWMFIWIHDMSVSFQTEEEQIAREQSLVDILQPMWWWIGTTVCPALRHSEKGHYILYSSSKVGEDVHISCWACLFDRLLPRATRGPGEGLSVSKPRVLYAERSPTCVSFCVAAVTGRACVLLHRF